jgi:xanthine dehydrogenase YagT iron-sulfur-binding subunit
MNVSRRRFMQGAAATAACGAMPNAAAQTPMAGAADLAASARTGLQPVNLNVNGRTYTLHIEPRVTLLDNNLARDLPIQLDDLI